jgi:lysophospholipase L1-like esterase
MTRAIGFRAGVFTLGALLTLGGVIAGAQAPAPQAAQTPPPVGAGPGGGRGQAAPPLSIDQLSCTELSAAVRIAVSNDSRLRDWPQINRYREANRTLTKADVVFMGDSITDFWPQPRFGEFFPGKNYVGRGISAQTTPQMLIRMRPDVVALKPRVLVILAGTNDNAGTTANQIKVVFSSILPTSSYHVMGNAAPQTTVRPLARIRAINDWMKKYAAEHKHVYLDYYSAMIDAAGFLKAELSNDDLHPNKAGYDVMAPLAERAIQQALASR